jgi:hypothetical protein
MNSKIPTVLALYNLGFISSDKVVEWADLKLINDSEPFDFISNLSLKGPDLCLKISVHDFPEARDFSYIEEFSLRLVKLNENYDLEVDKFVQWVSTTAIGEDIDQREVHLGYLVEHYFLECDDMFFAHNYLKKEIVDLLPECQQLADSIWQEIA